VGIAARDGDTDAAENSLGKTRVVGDFRPMRPAVGALVKPAARAAVIELPRGAIRLPHRGVEHLAVVRVHHQIDRAGLVIDVKHLLPALAAVGGLEHAAIGV
jgi:hypothetical protein